MPTDWDASKQRINSISHRAERIEDAFARFMQTYSAEDFKEWHSHTMTMWTSINPYLDNIEEETSWNEINQAEDVEEKLWDLRTFVENPPQEWDLEIIFKVHNTVQQCRINANLDIKRETKIDPETAGVDGLE